MEGVPDLWWADPAMRRKADLNSKHEESPITLMGLYEEALALEGVDVSMMAANSEIDAGIDRVNYCFKHDLLTICRKCTNAIGQIGSYVYDPKTGKPKGRQKDHMCDVLRYLISMVYDLVVLPEKEKEVPTVVEEIIRRMKWAQIGMKEEVALAIVAIVGMTFGFIMMAKALEYKLELVRVVGNLAKGSPENSLVSIVREGEDDEPEGRDAVEIKRKQRAFDRASEELMVDGETLRALGFEEGNGR